jgi:hypothetical protein
MKCAGVLLEGVEQRCSVQAPIAKAENEPKQQGAGSHTGLSVVPVCRRLGGQVAGTPDWPGRWGDGRGSVAV